MTTFDIDFKKENIRARIPSGALIQGDATFKCGLLLEGEFSGGVLKTSGSTIVLGDGKLSGFCDIEGDLYILGTVNAEKIIVGGVVHVGSTARLSGYVIGADFKLYAGCQVTAALNKAGQ